MGQWLTTGRVTHDTSHVKDFELVKMPEADEMIGRGVGRTIRKRKAIMGVFDEGCMGMYNAILPYELPQQNGIFKERLSQTPPYAAMQQVSDADAQSVVDWLLKKGMRFAWGQNEETELTHRQTLLQCKMYIAVVRLADQFGCDTVGIQYQQGLKDLTPASDLAEGLLNNSDRPPVKSGKTGRALFEGEPLPHFNEVDECAGLDGFVTWRLWRELGFAPENTLHDLRCGAHFKSAGVDDYVWVFLISGAAPPAHFIGGFNGGPPARQPPGFFPFGGGALKGIYQCQGTGWVRGFLLNRAFDCDLRVVGGVNRSRDK